MSLLKTKITQTILLTFSSILLASILSEIMCRLFVLAPVLQEASLNIPDSPLELTLNQETQYHLKKNFTPSVYSDFPNEGLRNKKQTNSLGFHDKDHLKNHPGPNIIFLGDSVLDGNFSEALFNHKIGIFDYEDLLSSQVERLEKDKSYEVFNFGINGYCTRDELNILKSSLKSLRPDLVILFFVDNDYGFCSGMLPAAPTSHNELFNLAFKYSHFLRTIFVTLSSKGYAPELLSISKTTELKHCALLPYCRKLKIIRETIDKTAAVYYPHLDSLTRDRIYSYFFSGYTRIPENDRMTFSAQSADVEASIKEIKSLLKGAKLEVFIWPEFEENKFKDIEMETEKTATSKMEIEKICDRLNIKCLRLSNIFSLSLNRIQPISLTVGDKQHLSEYGAQTIAPLIYAEVQRGLNQSVDKR